MSLSVTDIISLGEESLLGGNFHKANDVFAAALFIDPSCRPYLWQRGLSLYYCCQYEEGMAQFETDTRVNGGDVEEILWHFICKVKIMGYDGAIKDGFLPLSHSSAVPPPMHQVLALFKGYGTVEDILDVATPPSGQGIICSYNGANALGYGHFYIGLYYELRGMYQLAHGHFEKAIECKNEDFMGKLMIMHFGLFKSSIGCQPLIDPASYKYAPPIIYGGWQISSGHNQSVNHNVDAVILQLLKAVDVGINAFDCGDIYTGVEEIYGMMIGSHISRGGKRSDISINTKLVPDRDVILRGGVDLSYVTGVIQRSLNRLGTSYIDLVQFHWWAWSCDGYIDVAKLLMSFKEKQIIRQIGLTNFDLEHTREIVTAGVEVTTLQVQLSLLDRRPIDSGLLSYCVLNDISVLAYGVLAGGFLTDEWIGKSQPLKFSNRSLVKYHLIISEFGSWGLYQRLLSVLRVIGDRHSPLKVLYSNGCSRIIQTVPVAMVAIAYVLSLPGVGGVILGSLNINHIEESLFACQLKLTEQDIHDISLVVEKRCGPNGPVYDMERDPDGPHGRIMKYNLNQLNKSHHLEELCKRLVVLIKHQ
jgi:aryl-alcohol dehydrogenase-like predicted oxidoreductase